MSLTFELAAGLYTPGGGPVTTYRLSPETRAAQLPAETICFALSDEGRLSKLLTECRKFELVSETRIYRA